MDQTMHVSGSQRLKNPVASLKPEMREELVVELDYKTVKKEVWSKFIRIYGGGPSIVREKPYIYSTAVEENPIQASRLQNPSPMSAARVKKERAALAEPQLKKIKTTEVVPKQMSKQALEKLP